MSLNVEKDPERFRTIWGEHVKQLWALGSTLPSEKVDELSSAIKDLEGLVEDAAAELVDGDA